MVNFKKPNEERRLRQNFLKICWNAASRAKSSKLSLQNSSWDEDEEESGHKKLRGAKPGKWASKQGKLNHAKQS